MFNSSAPTWIQRNPFKSILAVLLIFIAVTLLCMAIGGAFYFHGAILGLGLIGAIIFIAVLYHISSTIRIGRLERAIGILSGTAALLFLWFISLFIYALVGFSSFR
jgi:hypothetical protein